MTRLEQWILGIWFCGVTLGMASVVALYFVACLNPPSF